MNRRLASVTTTNQDSTRYLRALLAWRTGDEPALRLVMDEVMADTNPNSSPNLLFAALNHADQWLDETTIASEDEVNEQLRAGIALLALNDETKPE